MVDVVSIEDFRLKRRRSSSPDMNVASCMHCGEEFPWGRRHDHRCLRSSEAKHPSSG